MNRIVLALLSGLAVTWLSRLAVANERYGVDGKPRIAHYDVEDLQRQPSTIGTQPATVGLPRDAEFSPEMLKKLMRPNFNFAAEWQAETKDIGLVFYDAGINFPVYPLFGPPPPLVNLGFAYTNVDAPLALGLPADLYQTELGLVWMRRINDRWMMRLMAGTSFNTDGNNQSSDAWRFRGGVFALYQRDPKWTLDLWSDCAGAK